MTSQTCEVTLNELIQMSARRIVDYIHYLGYSLPDMPAGSRLTKTQLIEIAMSCARDAAAKGCRIPSSSAQQQQPAPPPPYDWPLAPPAAVIRRRKRKGEEEGKYVPHLVPTAPSPFFPEPTAPPAPAALWAPAAPQAPVAPWAPAAPAAPAVLVSPVIPVGPVGPVGPAAPRAIAEPAPPAQGPIQTLPPTILHAAAGAILEGPALNQDEDKTYRERLNHYRKILEDATEKRMKMYMLRAIAPVIRSSRIDPPQDPGATKTVRGVPLIQDETNIVRPEYDATKPTVQFREEDGNVKEIVRRCTEIDVIDASNVKRQIEIDNNHIPLTSSSSTSSKRYWFKTCRVDPVRDCTRTNLMSIQITRGPNRAMPMTFMNFYINALKESLLWMMEHYAEFPYHIRSAQKLPQPFMSIAAYKYCDPVNYKSWLQKYTLPESMILEVLTSSLNLGDLDASNPSTGVQIYVMEDFIRNKVSELINFSRTVFNNRTINDQLVGLVGVIVSELGFVKRTLLGVSRPEMYLYHMKKLSMNDFAVILYPDYRFTVMLMPGTYEVPLDPKNPSEPDPSLQNKSKRECGEWVDRIITPIQEEIDKFLPY
jgi:hypothetical protein